MVPEEGEVGDRGERALEGLTIGLREGAVDEREGVKGGECGGGGPGEVGQPFIVDAPCEDKRVEVGCVDGREESVGRVCVIMHGQYSERPERGEVQR